MGQPDYNAALCYALNRLESELSPDFLYHSFTHTRDDVLVAVRKFAEHTKLSDIEVHLLEIAAVFHDIGFIFMVTGHEQRGAELAQEILPGFGFSQGQIEQIYHMIMATRLPQCPRNLLEELLADADLDVLGREDFLVRNDLLRQEIARLGKISTDEQWYCSQLKFLEAHSYFSDAARKVRGEGKQKNIDFLKQKIDCHEIINSTNGGQYDRS
jgi:predicted metal-dependent HD superfamily phosphohydrolase